MNATLASTLESPAQNRPHENCAAQHARCSGSCPFYASGDNNDLKNWFSTYKVCVGKGKSVKGYNNPFWDDEAEHMWNEPNGARVDCFYLFYRDDRDVWVQNLGVWYPIYDRNGHLLLQPHDFTHDNEG